MGVARFGEVRQRTRREVVDHVDVVAVGQQPVDQRRADEPRSSRDHHSHLVLLVSPSAREPDARRATVVPASTRAPAPTIDRSSTTAPVSTRASGPMTRRDRARAVIDTRAVEEHRPSTTAPSPTTQPHAERRRRRAHPHRRHPGVEERRRVHDRVRRDVHIAADPHARRALGAPSTAAARWRRVSTSAWASQVLLGRADVEPVDVAASRVEASDDRRACAGTSRARSTR